MIQIKTVIDQIGKHFQNNEFDLVIYTIQKAKKLLTPELLQLTCVK